MKLINPKGGILLAVIILFSIYTARKIPFIRNLILGLNDQEKNPYPNIDPNRNLHIPSGIGMSGTGL